MSDSTMAEMDPSDRLDILFDLLSSAERRATLRYLALRSDHVSIERLGDEVASDSHGRAVADLTEKQRSDTTVALHHVHLPRLEETGLVSWNRESNRVRLAPAVEEVLVTTPMDGNLLDVCVSVERAT